MLTAVESGGSVMFLPRQRQQNEKNQKKSEVTVVGSG
jgi:hypothetical protein